MATLSGTMALMHVKGALLACYNAVKGKGASAAAIVGKGADLKTVGDIAAREALLDYFKKSKLPIVVYSEELEKPCSFSSKPIYSAVCDDIDSTRNMSYGLGMLPHGSIVGIAETPNPKFSDFICSGFLEFNSGNLFYTVREKGAYLVRNWLRLGKAAKSLRLRTSGAERFADARSIILDNYMFGDLSMFFEPFLKNRRTADYTSTATHMVLVANGNLDLFVTGDNCPIQEKRKTGEEIGPFYLLLSEAGGAMLDWCGKDLGPEEVGLGKKKTFHVIAAATGRLGKDFAARMAQVPGLRAYMAGKKLLPG